MNRDTKRPVTIVTGFLGSGKTTLLTHVLTAPSMSNVAVIVNEFGDVGLDHHLLRRVNEHTLLLGTGCACCTIREDLAKTLLDLLAMDERGDIPRLERVIIETSGLADPTPIIFTILTDPVLQHHFVPEQVMTIVDAAHGQMHLDCHPEAMKQVTSADTIIITKTDLVHAQDIVDIMTRLSALNPSAHIGQAIFGVIDAPQLFEPGRQYQTDILSRAEQASIRSGIERETPPHLAETHSITLTFQEPLDWRAFSLWLSMLLHARGEQVLRVKGILDVGEQGPVILNGVQHSIYPPEHLDSWPDNNHSSQIIFITRGIPSQDILHSFQVFQKALQ